MGFEKVTEILKEPPLFSSMTDLASERLGGKVLFATDDFFAEKENLIKPGRGVFVPDKFTDHGKWMDGWETRRKRSQGHDWVVIKLGAQGIIEGLDIDTNFFLGNHPPFASVQAGFFPNDLTNDDWDNLSWEDILPSSSLDPGSHNYFACSSNTVFTHVRLHIYPDGGVARFRIFGTVSKRWDLVSDNDVLDLASVLNGGKAIACNDMFFSTMDNLIMPGRGINMGDGWETKRNRNPDNHDWVIIRLGHKGAIEKVVVDTAHFKGNYPDRFNLEFTNDSNDNDCLKSTLWRTMMPEQKLSAHTEHYFIISPPVTCTYVRLNIFPDGGVSRLRLFGKKIND